jgi:hypothetical protein
MMATWHHRGPAGVAHPKHAGSCVEYESARGNAAPRTAQFDLDELLELILTDWRKSTRTSASAIERKAIEIHNRRALAELDSTGKEVDV